MTKCFRAMRSIESAEFVNRSSLNEDSLIKLSGVCSWTSWSSPHGLVLSQPTSAWLPESYNKKRDMSTLLSITLPNSGKTRNFSVTIIKGTYWSGGWHSSAIWVSPHFINKRIVPNLIDKSISCIKSTSLSWASISVQHRDQGSRHRFDLLTKRLW